jgi:peptide chain release factor 3
MSPLESDVEFHTKTRRTFAIISHPDAGKTTLTEKLLLYSGMIQTAGMVRGKKNAKAATSDWMTMEQERGISITASAMQFEYKGMTINILDTPGHEDFSIDTYRTLTAADCAIMVIDAAKGVEKQTRKLFEVCRIKKIPVMTLINKMDMPSLDPLDLMDEVEKLLGIESCALNWPIGFGKEFQGVFDRKTDQALLFERAGPGGSQRAIIHPYSLSSLKGVIEERIYDELLDGLSLINSAGNTFDLDRFLKGEVTPVFFASALINFGIEPFFDAFITYAPSPRPYVAIDDKSNQEILIDPIKQPFSAYIFKLQANMNRKHRDNMAFLRVCSGKFERDLVVKHHRLKREIRLSRPHGMVAGDRTTLDSAYPGDIVGVINPGLLAIGDTLSTIGGFHYPPLPQFQPEVFARVEPKDTAKRKSFDKGIEQLTDEGAILLLKEQDSLGKTIFAAVGKLQFEVMQFRLKDEYGVETNLTLLPYECSSWVEGDLSTFKKPTNSTIVLDSLDRSMVLFSSSWEKQYAAGQNPKHVLKDIA